MSHTVIDSISFKTHIGYNAKHILASDKARAQKLLAGMHPHGPVAFHARLMDHGNDDSPVDIAAAEPDQSIDVTDAVGVTYTMPVDVGSPPTTYTLLIDTGSSNTWVGADQPYRPTSTRKSTRKAVSVSYGSGSFSGTEYIDQVALGRKLVIKQQSIGVASTAQGFNGVDGILGIGPVDLTTTSVKGVSSVPTVTDNLFSQKTITTESIGISYVPTISSNAANGEITFGGTDLSKFTGSINYVPISKTSPANRYWGIDQTITYGNGTQIMKTSAGIVDTGTTLLLLASDAFQTYQKATGATLDSTTGLLTVTEAQYENMQSMHFRIGSNTYELTANAQIWPRAMNTTIGGQDGNIYLITADLGGIGGSGLDFINGFVFLQRFYSVYDTTHSRIGLATTQHTRATTN